mgnify:CR=1 FL=1
MSRWNSGEIWFALVLILIGVLLLAGNLGLVAFDWSLVWPLALIFFGVWFIWRAFLGSGSHGCVFPQVLGLWFFPSLSLRQPRTSGGRKLPQGRISSAHH